MKISSIFLTLISITAIAIEYYLLMGWRKYKRLRSANNLESSHLENLTLIKRSFFGEQNEKFKAMAGLISKFIYHQQLLYYIILVTIGVVQFRLNLWIGGSVCILLGLIGFIRNIANVTDPTFHVNQSDCNNRSDSRLLINGSAGDGLHTANSYLKYLWILVFALLASSIFIITSDSWKFKQEWAAVAWIASVIFGIAAAFYSQRASHDKKNVANINQKQKGFLFLILIVGLGLFLRTSHLSEHPYPLSGDEASIAIVSKEIIAGEIRNYFGIAWAGQPIWSFLPTSLAIKILGDNILGIRAASVMAGTLAVLFTFLVADEMFNSTIAIISASFLATFPYNVHFSRVGVNNIMDSLMSSLVFWLLAKAIRTEDIRLCYLAGVFGGLCVYAYAGTKLVPLLGGIALLVFLYKKHNSSLNRLKYVLFFVIAVAISASPQIVSFSKENLLLGRMGQEGILFNGWLAQQSAFDEVSVFHIIWSQLAKTLLVFIASPASGIFYYTPKPYLTIAGSVLFLCGVSFSWTQRARPEYFTILIWFWAAVIIGGVLTKNPPATTRMLMTTPGISIFIGIGVYQIIEYLRCYGIFSKPALLVTTFAIIFFLCIQNTYFYMVEFRRNSYFQDASGEFAMEAGNMVRDLGDEYQVFIIGEPMIFSDFPTFRYLDPNNNVTNLNDGTITELYLAKSHKYVFFAIPENHILLERIMDRYIGGQYGTFVRKIKEKPILFEYYILGINN